MHEAQCGRSTGCNMIRITPQCLSLLNHQYRHHHHQWGRPIDQNQEEGNGSGPVILSE